GLFGFVKKQLLSVIEWKDDSKDTIVYRFPVDKREEIMNSSTLIVRESQCALFIHKGEICDVFGPGTYKLTTENIPFLTKVLSLPTGFDSRIKAEVYFVNTKQFIGQKWGTQNPIMMRDADFGSIRLRGFGSFAFKVDDAKVFMKECFGTNSIYKVDDVAEQCKSLLLENITDAIGESKTSALDLASNYKEISAKIIECSKPDFLKLGLKLCKVTIENLSLPEDVEKALDERSKLGILGDKMGTFTQYQSAQAIRDAAQNPSGGNLAGLGVGLGAGANIGKMFSESVATAKDAPQDTSKKVQCVKCGAMISNRVKFCPECGASQVETCPKCGEPVSKNSKFCHNCGESLKKEKVCPNCGKVCKSNAKFCSDCGEKF
ncbi:MAG: SPFH domain-containing protein, partial [Clostridia bacterium]|nr:SPFH domain-containing protein [Clostridia bacterium]